jgi:hypothetical protein
MCARAADARSRRCGVAHDEVRSNSSRGHRVFVEASIEADGRQGARNTGRMTFNDTPSGSASARAIGSLMRVRAAGALRAGDHRSQRGGEPDRPASRQDGVSGGELRAGGAATDRRLCGVRAAAADAGLQSIWRSGRTTAARARDRAARARSPARPDPAAQCAARDPGRARASMDLRGVRGSAAARCRRSPSDDSVRMFERWVPPIVQAWLAEHPPLMAELRAVLTGPRGCIQRDCRTGGARRDRRAPGVEVTVPPAQTDVDRRRGGGERRDGANRVRPTDPSFSTVSTRRAPSDLGASWSGCGRGSPTEPCR